MEISKITKEKIRELLEQNKRFDGREPHEFRKFSVEFGISSKAEGSARVKLGDTEVIAGIKMDLLEPFRDTPNEGVIMVGAELNPMASEKFEMGPPAIQAIELARSIDRAVRESEFIDLGKLCIKKGEKVWAIFIDIYPINDDGNLLDASALAAVFALLDTKIPEMEEDKGEYKVKYGEHTSKKLPLNKIPVTVTAYKVNDSFILDPTSEEEESSTMKLIISMTYDDKDKDGEDASLHGVLKSGESPIEAEKLLSMMKVLMKQGKKIHDQIIKLQK